MVRQIKKLAYQPKIGHLGTLDPLAQGVLPLFLGKMTKLISYFNQADKIYKVKARLGFSSDTLDMDGQLEKAALPKQLCKSQINAVLQSWVGALQQTPPRFSAIKKQGKPLYYYARKGQHVVADPRQVQIHWVELGAFGEDFIDFTVKCSKGTYVRSLVDELGKSLNTRAVVEKLIRTSVLPWFNLENSWTLEQLKSQLESNETHFFLDYKRLLSNFQQIHVQTKPELAKLEQGQDIELSSTMFENIKTTTQLAYVLTADESLLVLGDLQKHNNQHLTFQPNKVLQLF